MASTTYATMHSDHRQWSSDNDMWRCDISKWQEDLKRGIAELRKSEPGFREHETALRVHAAAIRLRGQELAEHEHSLAEYARGENEAKLSFLAKAHEKEAAKHLQQREAHERIKRHHRDLIAHVRSLHNALAKPV